MRLWFLLATILGTASAAQKLKPAELQAMAREQPGSVEFRDNIRATYKPEALKNGAAVSGIGPNFIWVFERPSATDLEAHPRFQPLVPARPLKDRRATHVHLHSGW